MIRLDNRVITSANDFAVHAVSWLSALLGKAVFSSGGTLFLNCVGQYLRP